MRAPIITSPSAPEAAQKIYRQASTRDAQQAGADKGEQTLDTSQLPSSGVLELLQARGWGTPKPALSEEQVFSEDSKPLFDFSYTLSDDEIDLIESQYRGVPGFEPPDAKPAAQVGPQLPPIVRSNLKKSEEGKDWLQAEAAQDMALIKVKAPSARKRAMTWDEYNALSDDQRAAVDWNTAFLKAREKDVGTSYDYTEEERAAYDERVEKMFGEGRGSDTYAPEVVALLEQINFSAVGQDLDEYLSLDRLIDTEELKDFKLTDKPYIKLVAEEPAYNPKHAPESTSLADVRSAENLANLDASIVAQAAKTIETLMANSETRLHTPWATLEAARDETVNKLGGSGLMGVGGAQVGMTGFPLITDTSAVNLQDPNVQKSLKFQGVYSMLLDPEVSWEDILTIDQGTDDPMTDDDYAELMQYINIRSSQDVRYGAAAPEGQRTAQDIRELLGIGG